MSDEGRRVLLQHEQGMSAICSFPTIWCQISNLPQIHQFYMSMMALRRNPQRKCKREEVPGLVVHAAEVKVDEDEVQPAQPANPAHILQ